METHGFADVQVLKDLAGLDRGVTGMWLKFPCLKCILISMKRDMR